MQMVQRRVNGNQAVAWAALEAGVDYFAHYPGSQVNLVERTLKQLAREHGVPLHVNDALNEHVAALAAAGASFCGARSLVVMKHVGMNIAADPFNYIGHSGTIGGMVIVVGTDPGANSSTGEEDTHWYVPQTQFPLLEPTTVSEIHACVKEGFDLSERYEVPVLVFIPGRLAYNSDVIRVPAEFGKKPGKNFYFKKDAERYINVGERAVRHHRRLLERIGRMASETVRLKSFFNKDATLGLVTRGATFGHVYEAVQTLGLADQVHLLNFTLVHPLHRPSVLEFLRGKDEVVFIEDQDGFLEHSLKMQFFNDVDCRILGKEIFPSTGEISYAQVEDYLAGRFGRPLRERTTTPFEVPERLGTLCEGCPHRGSYFGIDQALKGLDGIIGGDIGCSSLPPFRADWLMCMNAGIGISQGMSQILGSQTVVSTGGEGSFFHGGLLSLQSAVQNGISLLHVVFDNRAVAMTGHQPSPTTEGSVNWRKLLEAIGVDWVAEASAFEPMEVAAQVRKAILKKGVRVVWITGNCALQPDEEMLRRRRVRTLEIENKNCGSCALCYQDLGCPAIQQISLGKKDLFIDMNRCVRCGECLNVCPNEAIKITETES